MCQVTLHVHEFDHRPIDTQLQAIINAVISWQRKYGLKGEAQVKEDHDNQRFLIEADYTDVWLACLKGSSSARIALENL